jgi:hypothetical protein
VIYISENLRDYFTWVAQYLPKTLPVIFVTEWDKYGPLFPICYFWYTWINKRIILLQQMYNNDLNFTTCSVRSGGRFKCLPGKMLRKYFGILYTKIYLHKKRMQRQNSWRTMKENETEMKAELLSRHVFLLIGKAIRSRPSVVSNMSFYHKATLWSQCGKIGLKWW